VLELYDESFGVLFNISKFLCVIIFVLNELQCTDDVMWFAAEPTVSS